MKDNNGYFVFFPHGCGANDPTTHQVLLKGCELEGLYKLLISSSASVKSSSIGLPMCACLDSYVCDKKVEANSSICRNNVSSVNHVVSEKFDATVCAKSAVVNSLSNKSTCNDAFHKLSNNTIHVSVKNDSILFFDTSSKE